ncbi:MAG: PAS domain-containing protein [Desulfobacteraceae bacterium]|nr:PAS domain-containing protein [Desulfobacteraceae bacterium]
MDLAEGKITGKEAVPSRNCGEPREGTAARDRELIFGSLKQIADAIVGTFPRVFEVVVHDLSRPQKSIQYIAGDLTKRRAGGPVTDLVVKALHREGRDVRDRYGYKTTTGDGRTLKSTTSFIRNGDGDVVAAFCINFDMTDFLNAVHVLEPFTATADAFECPDRAETFATSLAETIQALFRQAVAKIGRQSAYMSTDEKIELVKELEASGVFQIKGGVDQVALLLGVTRYTVYNYLKKIHAEQQRATLR